jgi:pantoate--beta-alanine ligase
MHSYSTIQAIYSYVSKNREDGKRIGFVPTMGALHKGHLSLVERAKKENDFVICSIFVNPTQFNEQADLENYPSNLNRDKELLRSVSCDAVFFPSVNEMYPDQVKSEGIELGDIAKTMEGANRSGHFEGVVTIVRRLFAAVPADSAYFGEKDYQQLAIIKYLVKSEQIPVKIIGCPIVREENGLAMSSRNERLSQTGKTKASLIYDQLKWIREHYFELSVSELIQAVEMSFDEHDEFNLEYLSIADENTLQPFEDRRTSNHPRAFIAVWLEGVRLIDNIGLQE